jgi:subtilisin family serine protease
LSEPTHISATTTDAGAHLERFRDLSGRWLAPSLDGEPPPPAGFTGKGVRTAVIDTGVVAEHPIIARALTEQHDLTGEGVADENGHGTIVSLLLLSTAPGTQLVNLKAFTADGSGDAGQLLQAMELTLELGVRLVNLSGGIFRPNCRADCDLCAAATRLTEAEIFLVAAAGNTPGQTDCPAKSGVLGNAAIAVTAFDIDAQRLAPYAGDGTFAGDVGHYTMKPIAQG